MAQTYTYQQIYDRLKAEGAFDQLGLGLSVQNVGVTIDLQQYQEAVLKLDFKEFTDTTLVGGKISATATSPSVEQLMNISKRKVNTYVPDADGGSILVNADRVVINANSDYAMLFGKKGVALASPNRVNIDAGSSITLFGHNDQGLFIGLPNKGLQVPKAQLTQKQLGETKGDPTPDYSYEPIVLGVKLANLLEDILFVLQNADMASSLSEAKWQPSTVAEFALLANRIPEILSTHTYVDGISHESIDQERLQKLTEAQKLAEPYIPPTEIAIAVSGEVVGGGTDSFGAWPTPIGQNTVIPKPPGAFGYPITDSTRNFVNKYCGGVIPANTYPDGTMEIDLPAITENNEKYQSPPKSGNKKRVDQNIGDPESLIGRYWLKPNRAYTSALLTVQFPGPSGTFHSVRLHPQFAQALQAPLAEIAQNGGGEYIKYTAGAFVGPRNVTNGTRLSNHSYGFAVDLNSKEDGFRYESGTWDFTAQTFAGKPWTDFQRGFYNKVGSVMMKHGITWLSSMDPMHFSIHE